MNDRGAGVRWVAATTCLFLYVPLFVLAVLSFNDSRLSMAWHGWTLKWYARLVQDSQLLSAAVVSVKVGLWSTMLALVAGTAAALALEQKPERRPGLEALMMVPLVIPEIMMGVACMLFFVLLNIPLGLFTVTLSHAAFNAPLVMVLVRARLKKLDPAWQEAARDLGATSWQAFRWITLPLLRPALQGAALLSFTVSLDDFLVTFFTAGPGATTLPLRVYSTIRSGVTPELNALSTVVVALSVLLVGAALWLQRDRAAT